MQPSRIIKAKKASFLGLLIIATMGILFARQPKPDPHAAGEKQIGLNAEPAYRPWRWRGGPNPDSWWDPSTGNARVDLEMPLIQQSYATWIRIEFPWTWIEPEKGSFDWSHADYIVNSATSHNLQVEATLVFCPPWEGAPNCIPNPTDWQAFLTAFAEHFAGKIRVFDLWNEADLCCDYFSGSATEYVNNIVIPGNHAIKAVNPDYRVVVERSNGDTGFIDTLRSAGAQFDIYAWHGYNGASSANRDSFKLRKRLNSAGYANAALWLDELGIKDGTGSNTSWLLSRVMARGANAATNIKLYNLRDDAIYDSGTTIVHWDQYGLMTNSNYGASTGTAALETDRLAAPQRS